MYLCTCALLALFAVSPVWAAPTGSHLLRRQNQNSDTAGSLPQAIWIPLVVIGILLFAGMAVACGGRRFRGWSANWGTSVAQAAGVTTGTTTATARELTADQLAGNTRNGGNAATTTNAANGGTNRARRPRRNRRTPSQISTHSLPAYNKEPGEQEIVIVRGAEDMEDMPIPITVTMPVVDEQGPDTPEGSIDLTRQTSMYVPMPNTPTDMPLLHNNEYDPQHRLSAVPSEYATRRSFDSVMSSDDNSHARYLDDAPPYEAVALDSTADLPAPAPTSAAAPPTGSSSTAQASQERASTEQQPGTGSTRRRSMFMSIFNPRNSRLGPSPVPTTSATSESRTSTHTREGSGPSVISVAPSEREPRPRSRVRHRPSHSGSSSMFSLLSRTRSNGNLVGGADRLTSPSMISLNSISSPLSHTLVRTEFTYPKSGPTPEQLRLISSRESFARFGVPYGPDAVAYAASTSRVELEPPPGFEEVAGSAGAGPSSPEQNSASGSLLSSSSDERNDSPSPGPAHEAEGAETNAAEPGSSSSAMSAGVPQSGSSVATEVDETSRPLSAGDGITTERSEAIPQAKLSPPSAALALPVSSASSESASLSSPTALLTPPATSSAASPTTFSAPPSAYKGTVTTASLPSRATSRASSYMTFQTADESLYASEPPTPTASRPDLHAGDEEYESAAETPVSESAPSTPRLAPRHMHESTDTTITPDR
ncbi:hypothetical protein BV20DRAFT_978286 [Pilatotrama ljubarskyi]|nr:hypothetical protein BV20DRAFT_978286 [Pilatotrama ljubarskyi]